MRGLSDPLARDPTALSETLLAVDFATDAAKQIVIVCPASRVDGEPLLAPLRATFVPNRALTRVVMGDDAKAHVFFEPSLDGKVARGGRATAYVCEGPRCEAPTGGPAAFAAELRARPDLQKAR